MKKTRWVIVSLLAWWLVGAMAPSAIGQTAPQSTGTDPQQLRRIADQLYSRGRFDEARDVYLQIHSQFARDAELNRNLGWCFYRGRRPDPPRAIHYWQLSWQVEENELLRLEAARAYVRIGRWEDGVRLLQDLAERHPQHPEHWRELATLAESQRKFPQAIAWHQSFLERRPGDIPGRLQLARLLSWEKKYTEAITEYNIVLQTNPQNIPAQVGTAQVLSWQGRFHESLKLHESVLERQPTNREAQTGRAFVLLWMGRPQEAKPIFELLAKRHPADQDVRGALKEIARLEGAGVAPAAVAQAPPATDPLGRLRVQAEEALQQNDGVRAVSLFRQAVQLAPGDLSLQRRLAQAYLVAGQFDAAITLVRELSSKNPEVTDLLRELAQAQSRAGKLSEGADTLRAYVQRKPEDTAARVELGRWLSWSRRFEESAAAYQGVLRGDPENVEALVGLGQVNAWQGRFTAALKLFDAVLGKQPEQREALIGKSQALYWSGRTEEAFKLLELVQEKLPQDREVASLLESFRAAERQRVAERAAVPPDVDTLIRSYQDILSRNPRDFEALRMLGELFGRKNNFKEAVVYYRRAHQERPQERQIQLTLARMLSWNREYNESVQLYRDLMRKDPAPNYMLELARVLSWAGRHSESVEVFERVLELQPNLIEARLGIARVQSWGRSYDQSLQNYRLILEQDPKNREAQVEYARVHAWKGDLNRAVKLYSEMEESYPKDRDVLLGKAQALQWSGRAREAKEILEPLRVERPKDQEVLLAMAGTQMALGRQDLALRELRAAESIAPDNRDVQLMRSLILKQVRPTLVLNFNPSFDSDDLHILPYTGTLYFSLAPRVRSYVRASIISSMIPFDGISQGREVVFGASSRVQEWLILRGEVGGNSGAPGEENPIGGGGFTLLASSSMRFDFDISRQFVNYLPRPVRLDISRVQIRAGWDYRPTNKWLFHLDYFHGRYSDTNRSHGANFTGTRTLVKSERATLETGYMYSVLGFSEPQLFSGYFAPSQLQRHAGLGSLYGRISPRIGYNITGTLGAEQIFHDPFRPDGTLRVSTDLTLAERLKLTLGYGYFRIASLVRAGARPVGFYRTHAVFSTLEIQF